LVTTPALVTAPALIICTRADHLHPALIKCERM
jgi:hypothetical protein